MQAETVALVTTIVVSGVGSSLATIRILLHQMNQMEIRLTDQIKENRTAIAENRAAIKENCTGIKENCIRLDDQSRRFDEMNGELRDLAGETQKTRESLARVEGFLMGSGDFRLGGPFPPADNEPPTDRAQ